MLFPRQITSIELCLLATLYNRERWANAKTEAAIRCKSSLYESERDYEKN
jgi:hypothetical protein